MSKAIDELEERNTLLALGYPYADDFGDYRLYHYTDRCVKERAWNAVTLNSRGHIFHRGTGECIGRPFAKFFNMGELPGLGERELPWRLADLVTEKLDGWMGTVYRMDGKHCVATSGSMTLAVARMATCRLDAHHASLDGLPDDVTLVLELLSPETRVVIDYGPRWRMVLLAAFNRHSGAELPWHEVERLAGQFRFELPKVLWKAEDGGQVPFERIAETMRKYAGESFEGYVVRFSEGWRVKAKSPAYQAALRMRNQKPMEVIG